LRPSVHEPADGEAEADEEAEYAECRVDDADEFDESDEAEEIADDCCDDEYCVILFRVRFAVSFQEWIHDADACVIDDEQHDDRQCHLQHRMDVLCENECRQCKVVHDIHVGYETCVDHQHEYCNDHAAEQSAACGGIMIRCVCTHDGQETEGGRQCESGIHRSVQEPQSTWRTVRTRILVHRIERYLRIEYVEQ